MKIKNIIILALGVLSFSCAIGMEKISATPSFLANASPPPPKSEIVQVSQGSLSANELEDRAAQLYETGQFGKAIELLDQLSANYASQNDKLGRARVFRNLALVYKQTGEWSKANAAITNSLNSLETISNTAEPQKVLAQVLEVKGLLELSAGEPESALETWKKAADIYQQIGDAIGVTKSQINQAQAWQRMGQYQEAIETLNEVNLKLQKQPDNSLKMKGLQSLAIALRVVGELDKSENILQQSLAIAQEMSDPESVAASFLGLGNTARLQNKLEAATDYYQRATAASSSPYVKIRSQLNQLSLLVEQKKWAEAEKLVPGIQSILERLPVSQIAINARINLANSLRKMGKQGDIYPLKYSEIAQLLATAVQQAENLQDKRSLAYAWGNLGRLYEENKQWEPALELTQKSLMLSQSINASDIAYRWQWQMGRLLKKQGDRESAIAAYTEAVNTIQSIRSDLVATSVETQFSFQESIEPIYRELIDLLLPIGKEVEESALKEARDLIDSLQLAELDNFFKDACLKVQPIAIDQIDPKAAGFSTIILSDRLEVILALPGQTLRRYTTLIPRKELESTIIQARNALIIPRLQLSLNNFLVPSQKVYDWLIRPIEQELTSSGVQTLVFVLDGVMRNIPMTALYDGKNYLIERYSVALAPSLKLVDAKPLGVDKLEVLTAGLSEARQGFAPLPGVNEELAKIGKEVNTEELLNQSFTTANFKAKVKLSDFPVIHLATHGQFSSQANDTFILTYDDRISAKALDSLLRTDASVNRPVELLVLSACQTATGDNRAVLGLTGMAIRAGARSTIASLWSVNDEATSLMMIKFYEELANLEAKGENHITKAEALRRAEQAILQTGKFSHPYFWSAFILVGNWL